MDRPGTLPLIEDDLSEDWLVEPSPSGVEAVDAVAKSLALLSWLDDDATSRWVYAASSSARPRARSSMPFGIAPTAEACGSPLSKSTIIGIDITPKRCASACS